MARSMPDERHIHIDRSERARRERMRLARQRAIAVAVLAVIVIAGIAFAISSTFPSSPAGAQPSAATTETAAPTVEATPVAPAASAVEPTPTAPVAPATPAAPAATGIDAIKPLSPAPGVKTIVVDKSEQRVTLYTSKGKPVDTFRCSSGVIYPRIGTYKLYGRRQQSWSMYDNSTFYYFTMFVKSDKDNNIGFHSVPQNPDGSLVKGKLGKPVSHGCVRLEKEKAKFVYGWAGNGTKVVVKK